MCIKNIRSGLRNPQIKMKLLFKRFKIHAGSYDFAINFLITPDINRAIKFVNFKLELPCADYLAVNDSDFNYALGKHFGRKGYVPVIWLPDIPKTPDQLGTLTHELFHGVCSVMRWANVPLGYDSEEAYCHLMKYLTKQFFEHIQPAK